MAEITLYNTHTRRKEPLARVAPGKASMYVCGPTVYDRAHIGNARPVVVFDVLFRLLRHMYGADNVTYVRNITDVEDKINARAKAAGLPIGEITAETTRWFHEDMDALGALRPTFEPRATEYIGEMVAMIAILIERGHAYAAEGHVLFAVGSYPAYGELARRSLDDMRAGARVEVAPYKRDPMDFVLWKPSDAETPGWESPWGRGRPGWHIECSAMARALLGEAFDIHGGGVDLAFPHHENELAQSVCAHPDEGFARVWMHNGMLNIEGEKMSKSLGNFFTVRDLLDRGVPGEVIRFVFLSTHYRQPIDWTERKVEEATATLRKWRILTDGSSAGEPLGAVRTALSQDLNTPLAITAMHELSTPERAAEMLASANLMGLLTPELAAWNWKPRVVEAIGSMVGTVTIDAVGQAIPAARINELLRQRFEARKQKDFARADRIRDALAAAGVDIKDTPAGAEWTVAANFDPARLEALSR